MTTAFLPHKVLVTGGCGFIASHLVDALLTAFPDVTIVVLDALTSAANRKNLTAAMRSNRVQLVVGDIRSFDLVLHLLRQHRFDSVMHLAALTNVDLSFESNALEFMQVNCIGTQTLLEACRVFNAECANIQEPGVLRIVNTLTDEIFGSCTEIQHGDDGRLAPTNPYSASKAAAMMVGLAYWRSYRLPIVHISPNNVYGPRQCEKLIYKWSQRLMRQLPPQIHGNGEQLRSWLHVHDAAQAFLVILRYGEPGLNYNVEADVELRIKDMAFKLLKSFGQPPDFLEFTRDRLFNDQRYYVAANRIRALGWTPKVAFEHGLESTLEWYRNHRDYWPEEHIMSNLDAHPQLPAKRPFQTAVTIASCHQTDE